MMRWNTIFEMWAMAVSLDPIFDKIVVLTCPNENFLLEGKQMTVEFLE